MKICPISPTGWYLSCYTHDELKELAGELKITSPPEIREELLNVISEEIFKRETSKKPSPEWKGKHGWLNNFDIRHVLTKYEGHNGFKFLGIFRMDFWSFPESYKSTRFEPGFDHYGLILHLGGCHKENFVADHWVCMFIDLRNPEIQVEFFDPAYFGIDDDQVLQDNLGYIYKKIILQLKLTYRKNIRFSYNKNEIQTNDYDCGLYVIDYLIHRINNGTMENYAPGVLQRKKYFKIEK